LNGPNVAGASSGAPIATGPKKAPLDPETSGTFLTYVSLAVVDRTPLQLRQHAEHCRHLANSQVDERIRLILRTMAGEFDKQAVELDHADESEAPALT